MLEFINYQFNKKMVSIQLGEYYVTEEDIIIHTVLGSCISVCLYAAGKNITGINHFMLPSNPLNNIASKPGQYGINAMELMFAEFVKKGICIKSLKAKVFGGGNIARVNDENNIGSNNIKFIFDFLKMENISVIEKDVGGYLGRKIFYFTKTHDVTVITTKKIIKIETEEEKFQKRLQKNILKEPDITFFK